jgi:hypothetical protein
MNADPKRFRGRTVPAGILCAFGVISSGFALWGLIYMVYTNSTGEPMYEPGPSPGFTRDTIVVTGASAFSAAVLFFALFQWWRGRWWLAILLVAALWLIFQAMAAIGLVRD